MAKIKSLLPQFGMGMQDGEIVRWLKAVGDPVDAVEVLVEVVNELVCGDEVASKTDCQSSMKKHRSEVGHTMFDAGCL